MTDQEKIDVLNAVSKMVGMAQGDAYVLYDNARDWMLQGLISEDILFFRDIEREQRDGLKQMFFVLDTE